MKRFDTIVWDYAQCRKEVQELDALLRANSELDERKTILPFFQQRRQLAALCGSHPSITVANRIAYEFDLFGAFSCDLVVGIWGEAYSLIEFEDAKANSIFAKKKNKATPEWSQRFEHGHSQIIDWFFKLADMGNTSECEALFGKKGIDYEGVLVIGRDQYLGLRERSRLDWRRNHLVLNSRRVQCITFDELLLSLKRRLETLDLVKGTSS